MLNMSRPVDQLPGLRPEADTTPFAWLLPVLLFLRRRWAFIAGVVLLAMVLGVANVQLTRATFTASTALSIDARRAHPFRQQPLVSDSGSENAFIESQVEIMRSDGTARAVVRKLDLVHHPLFNERPGAFTVLRNRVTNFVRNLITPASQGGGPAVEDDGGVGGAAQEVARMMSMRRVGQTSIVELSATTPDPNFSATLANAYAETFISLQLESIADNTRRAGSWLEERLQALRTQAVEADQSVQRYKAENQIVDTNLGLLNEQTLGELNTQLAAARATAASAAARLARIESITNGGGDLGNGAVADSLLNPVIVQLRTQYLTAARRESEWSQRYGRNHAAAVNARNEMEQLTRAIRDELGRIAQTYRSDAAVALSNEQDLEARLGRMVQDTARTNADRIMLRSLQSNADTYKAIYENFLQRYTQAMQDQSYPIPDARVVNPATPPTSKSGPRLSVGLLVATTLGLVLAFGAAFLRELLDRSLRTPARLYAATGIRPLGALPRLGRRAVLQAARRSGLLAEPARPEVRQLATGPSLLRQAVSDPMSPFAEVVRSVQVRILQQRQNGREVKVIGIVSSLRGEGATTLAANLAQMLASSGHLTLLVDADMRGMDLSRNLSGRAAPGLFEVLGNQVAVNDVVWRDPQTGLRFLPATATGPVPHAAALLASRRAREVMDGLRATYDYIVLDLPPLATAMDAHAAADLAEGFVLTVEWGRTREDVVVDALHRFDSGDTHLLGAVLNKTNLRELPRWTGAPTSLPAWSAPAALPRLN